MFYIDENMFKRKNIFSYLENKFTKSMKYLNYCLLFAALFLFACKSEKGNKAAMGDKKDTSSTVTSNEEGYRMSPFIPSTTYPDATLSNMSYKDGQFNFDVASDSYSLGQQTPDAKTKMCANSGKGQHIHLIVDNKPYAAKYTNSFEYDIEDGEHHILAFLSRSYHESIKTETAHLLKKVTVKDRSIVSESDVKEPMITYSRPKGTYVGDDTKKVMLDFYLSNVELKDGYSVKAEINGDVHHVIKWQPYYIEGLPMGKNTIKLTLMKDGKTVDTPLNPVTREFMLKADPAPEK